MTDALEQARRSEKAVAFGDVERRNGSRFSGQGKREKKRNETAEKRDEGGKKERHGRKLSELTGTGRVVRGSRGDETPRTHCAFDFIVDRQHRRHEMREATRRDVVTARGRTWFRGFRGVAEPKTDYDEPRSKLLQLSLNWCEPSRNDLN